MGRVEYVVQHARRDFDDFTESGEIKLGLGAERIFNEMGQIDRAQAAATIGWQRLFGTGVRGFDQFAVVKVVVLVHAIQEQDAWLSMIVGGLHDLIPQVAGLNFAIDPQAVFALVGTFGQDIFIGFGHVHQFNGFVGFNGHHERVGNADRNIEVGQVALVFGVNEQLDIRVVTTHDTHLGAATCTGRLHGFAGAVKHTHVRHRARSARVRAFNTSTLRTNRREVVTHTAATAHGFSGFGQGCIDAGTAIDRFNDRVPNGLHKAVDQRGLQIRTGRRVDTARWNKTVFLRPKEFGFPLGAVFFVFNFSQSSGHTGADLLDRLLFAFGVFFDQYFGADFLGRQVSAGGSGGLQCVCFGSHYRVRNGLVFDEGWKIWLTRIYYI